MKPTERKNPGESKNPRLHGIHWMPGSDCFWSWICISHPPRFCKPANILFMFKPTWIDFLFSYNHESHKEDAFLGFILFLLLITPWWCDKHLLTLQDSVLENSLVVQLLGLGAFTVIAQVQSLIPQAMWHGQKKKKKTRLTSSTTFLWTVLNKSSSPL